MSLLLLLLATVPIAITTEGLGPFRVGTPIVAVHDRLDTTVPQGNDDAFDCAIYPADRHPGVLVMVERGMVTRVAISETGFKTVSGIGIGMTETDLARVYGKKLKIVADPYGEWPTDKYLTFRGASGNAIRFITHDEKIVEIIVGRSASVEYIEGCL